MECNLRARCPWIHRSNPIEQRSPLRLHWSKDRKWTGQLSLLDTIRWLVFIKSQELIGQIQSQHNVYRITEILLQPFDEIGQVWIDFLQLNKNKIRTCRISLFSEGFWSKDYAVEQSTEHKQIYQQIHWGLKLREKSIVSFSYPFHSKSSALFSRLIEKQRSFVFGIKKHNVFTTVQATIWQILFKTRRKTIQW